MERTGERRGEKSPVVNVLTPLWENRDDLRTCIVHWFHGAQKRLERLDATARNLSNVSSSNMDTSNEGMEPDEEELQERIVIDVCIFIYWLFSIY